MNINQLPKDHYTLSFMAHPLNSEQRMWFVTNPNVITYRDVDIWICDKDSGDLKEIIPYMGFTDFRIANKLEQHVEENSVNFLYPTVISSYLLGGIKENPRASKALCSPSSDEIIEAARAEHGARKLASQKNTSAQ